MASRAHICHASFRCGVATALPKRLGSVSLPADFGVQGGTPSAPVLPLCRPRTAAGSKRTRNQASRPARRVPRAEGAARLLPNCLPGGRHRLFWKLATD